MKPDKLISIFAKRESMAQERWQLIGTAPECYEQYQVPNIAGPLARAFLAHLPIEPGQKLLDVGCGTGIIAREAAYMVGTKGSITSIDLNEEMLRIARRQAPSRSTQLTWHQGDAEDLPFCDAQFDVVLCQQALQFFPNKQIAVSEMYRVLKPAGWVGLCVWRDIDHSPLHHATVEALRRHVGEEAAEQVEAPFSFGNADALWRLMSEAGFSGIDIWAAEETVSVPPVEVSVPSLLASTPSGPVFAGLSDHSRNAIIDDVAKALQSYSSKDGITVPQAAHIALAKKNKGQD